MAYEFYVTITGDAQGAFKGESSKDAQKEKIPGIGYQHEIKAPKDVQTGQASGSREHKPVTICKEWGASSPQLFLALCTNEVLSTVVIEFMKTTRTGVLDVYHTITLEDAQICNIAYGSGEAGSTRTTSEYDTHELEWVSFTYRKIITENVSGQTSAEDDWNAR